MQRNIMPRVNPTNHVREIRGYYAYHAPERGLPVSPQYEDNGKLDDRALFLVGLPKNGKTFDTSDGSDVATQLLDQASEDGRNKRFMAGGRNGLEGDTFSEGWGAFDTMKKRFYGKNGLHDDTFNDGFGTFGTMKRNSGKHGFYSDLFDRGFGRLSTMKKRSGKRDGKYGFDSDTFSLGFGDFSTM